MWIVDGFVDSRLAIGRELTGADFDSVFCITCVGCVSKASSAGGADYPESRVDECPAKVCHEDKVR